MKKAIVLIITVWVLIIAVMVAIAFNNYREFMRIKTIAYDKYLTIVEGGGGNSIILASEDGAQALVVDTKMGGASKKLVGIVKAKDITVVNTHHHRDHMGGNRLFPTATLIAGAYSQNQWRAMAGKNRFPDKVVPIGREIVLKIGSETVHVRNMGRAHTWNDVVVYLENRKFLITGDLVFNHRHPALFAQGGANAAAWVTALDSLLARYDAKAVLPGHGELSDMSAVRDMKEYFVSIQDAFGNPEKMKILKEKYKDYSGIPGLANFDKTVRFLEDEKKGKQ